VLRWVKLSHNLCAGFVAGFWQTPFWDGVTRYLPRDRPWLELELNIPEDHSVMISFEQLGVGLEPMLRMRCPRENMVEVKVPSQPSFFERYCDDTKNTLPKLIASASKVLIAYQLTFNPLHVNTGFKLRFSWRGTVMVVRTRLNVPTCPDKDVVRTIWLSPEPAFFLSVVTD